VLPVGDVIREIGVPVAEILHRRDVGAGGEGFLASGQNDRSDAGIGVERGERPAELGHELRTERVQLLRPVQRDDADPAPLLDADKLMAHDRWHALAGLMTPAAGCAGRRRRGFVELARCLHPAAASVVDHF